VLSLNVIIAALEEGIFISAKMPSLITAFLGWIAHDRINMEEISEKVRSVEYLNAPAFIAISFPGL
jgi:hypothetical protein